MLYLIHYYYQYIQMMNRRVLAETLAGVQPRIIRPQKSWHACPSYDSEKYVFSAINSFFSPDI
jgi:hypothetical protein